MTVILMVPPVANTVVRADTNRCTVPLILRPDQVCHDGRVQTLADKASEEAVQALMLASRAFVGLAARSLAAVDEDVTLPQFRTLVVLATRGPQRSIDIADELRVNPSTGTRMCDRLARKGLIRRVRSSADRRVVRLRLTPAGLRLVDEVIGRRRADLAELVAATADRWKPSVTRALRAFAEAAGEMPEQGWWLGWAHDLAEADGIDDGVPVPVRRQRAPAS
jgi:DNA-binding MarR family transcriptional regulator